MSDTIKRRMDLSNLKTFLNSSQNLEFLSEAEESVNFTAVTDTHFEMLKNSNEPDKYISIDSDRQAVDNWLLSSFDLFQLEDTFYLKINDFSYAPWVKVKVHGKAQDWLLSLYQNLSGGRIQFVPLSLQFVFELRRQEHRFSTFIGKVT